MCLVENLVITSPNKVIKSIDGNLSPSQFIGIEIKNTTMNYFPKGIGKFFPNLKVLRVRNTKLKVIEKNDFKFMSKLEMIDISGQDLKNLDGNLFDYTPKLRFVYLSTNQLNHIGFGLLEGLKQLQEAYFSFNACIDRDATSENEIPGLILEMKKTCPPAKGVKCKKKLFRRNICFEKNRSMLGVITLCITLCFIILYKLYEYFQRNKHHHHHQAEVEGTAV